MSGEIPKDMQSFFIALTVISVAILAIVMFYVGWYQGKPDLDVVAGYILTPVFLLVGAIVGYYFGNKSSETQVLMLKQLLAEKKQ